ncbi:hypothetical protein GCM10010385_25950 [Streptomyces geysiriensis]|nr:hypothetical protein GCM10010385_25950 [Streptomyces geysiriensis]
MTWADGGIAVGAVSVMGRPIVRWDGRGRAGGAEGGARERPGTLSPEGEGVGQALTAGMIRVP